MLNVTRITITSALLLLTGSLATYGPAGAAGARPAASAAFRRAVEEDAPAVRPRPGAAAHVSAEAFSGRPVSFRTVRLTGKLTRRHPQGLSDRTDPRALAHH